jgi:hypothetical protein
MPRSPLSVVSSAAGTRTIALIVLILLCASAAATACGGTSTTTSTSPSVAPSLVAASMAVSLSAAPLPKAAGRGTIAFTKVSEGSMDIYVVRSDGRGLKRLAANARGPAWSPDGSKIALGLDSQSYLAPGTALYVAKADGSEVWKVPNTDDAYDPAWRPE